MAATGSRFGNLVRVLEQAADSDADGVDDGDASGEFIKVCARDKTSDESVGGKRAQRERVKENDDGMGVRRRLAQVGELEIQSRHHEVFIVGRAGKLSNIARSIKPHTLVINFIAR